MTADDELLMIQKHAFIKRSLITAYVMCQWIAVSCTVILFNKYVVDSLDFRYPVVLVTMHMLFATITTQIGKKTGLLQIQDLPAGSLPNLIRIACAFGVSLVYGNAAYMYLSVAYIQMMKASSPIWVMLSSFLLGLKKCSVSLVACIIVIASGVGIATFAPDVINWLGFAVQAISLAAEVMRLTFIELGFKANGTKPSSFTMLFYVAPSCTIVLSVPCCVELLKIFGDDPGAFHRVGASLFLANCTAAFALNVASLLVVSSTSALTMNVCGIAKDFLLILYSQFVNGAQVSHVQYIGYSIATSGIFAYSNLEKIWSLYAQIGGKRTYKLESVQTSTTVDHETDTVKEGTDAPTAMKRVDYFTTTCLILGCELMICGLLAIQSHTDHTTLHVMHNTSETLSRTSSTTSFSTPFRTPSRLGCWNLHAWPLTKMNSMPDVYRSEPPFTSHTDALTFSSANDIWKHFDPVQHKKNYFACIFEGTFVATRTKTLKWMLSADDGSELHVNREKMIDNGFMHMNGRVDKFAEMSVVEGRTYDVISTYFQAFGNVHWSLFYMWEDEQEWTVFYSNMSVSKSEICSTWCNDCSSEECSHCPRCTEDQQPTNVHLVVNVFNENVDFIPSYLLRIPYSKLYLYCKGGRLNDARCINIENYCCESYGYLVHIVNNYDSLAEITVFIRASVLKPEMDWMVCKNSITVVASLMTVQQQETWPYFAYDRSVLQYYFPEHFEFTFYRTQIGKPWGPLCRSHVRPLGKFITEVTGESLQKAKRVKFFHGAQFGARRATLRRVALETFINIKRQFEYCPVDKGQEVGHYMERTWLTLLSDERKEQPHIVSYGCPEDVKRVV